MPTSEPIMLSDHIILDETTAEYELIRLNQNLSVLAHQLYFNPKNIGMDALMHTDTIADARKMLNWLYAKAFENKEDNTNE